MHHQRRDERRLDARLVAAVETDAVGADPAGARVVLRGELDVLNHRELTALLAGLRAAGCRRLALDLRALTFCDAAGIRALESAERQLRADGGALVLHGASPLLQLLLELDGLADRVATAAAGHRTPLAVDG